MIPRTALPSLVTVLALLLGLAALVDIAEGDLVSAAWLIGYAGLLDVLDGLVARALHAQTEIGRHLDSLCDAVTVGVAPALLLQQVWFADGGVAGVLVPGCWLVAVLVRLARFEAATPDPLYFCGLPSPPAASVVAGLVLVCDHLGRDVPGAGVAALLVAGLSYLMLTTVRVEKAGFFTVERLVRSWQGRAMMGGVALGAVWPWAWPLVACSAIAVVTLVRDLGARFRAGPAEGGSPVSARPAG